MVDMKRLLLFILLLFSMALLCKISNAADVLLMGYDASLEGGWDVASDSVCSYNDQATSISAYKWKAMRVQAQSTATVDYFMLHVDTATDCDDDSGCWAIYEDATCSGGACGGAGNDGKFLPGARKGYGCWNGYNWSSAVTGDHDADGIGVHKFPATNTDTSLSVTSGNWYWIVIASHALNCSDGTGSWPIRYTRAGCSAPITTWRGRDWDGYTRTCNSIATPPTTQAGLMYINDFIDDDEVLIGDDPYNFLYPPSAGQFEILSASYFMWGVWEEDTGCTDAGDCTGGTECQTPTCTATVCSYPDKDDDTACTSDSLYCTGDETCQSGVCTSGGNPCSETVCNTCQEATDSCYDPEGTACTSDDNPCTDDECDGAGTCDNNNNTDACDDTLFCNGTDTCSGGTCSDHTGDPCEVDEDCNETTDQCDCTIPTISGVSGTVSHGGTITLSGGCFGTKSPVPPVVWDDGESSVLATMWDDYAPKSITSDASYNMAYRTTSHRGIENPHTNGNRFLAGGHKYNADRAASYNAYDGNSVGVHHYFGDLPSGEQEQMYIYYYEALDTDYPSTNATSPSAFQHNHKEIDFSGNNNETIYGSNATYPNCGTTSYDGFTGSPGNNGCNVFNDCTNLNFMCNDAGCQDNWDYCNNDPNFCITRASLAGNWRSFEHVIDFDNEYFVKSDNQLIFYEDDIDSVAHNCSASCRGCNPASDVCPSYGEGTCTAYNDFEWINGLMIGGYGCYQSPVELIEDDEWTPEDTEWYHTSSPETKHLFRSDMIGTADNDLTKDTEWTGTGELADSEWAYYNGRIYIGLNPVSTGRTHYATNSACGSAGGAEAHNGHDDAWRYYDDIYIDNTFSRVMLCNNSTYASATICEPQIPHTTWNDGSIALTVNQGALTGETAYLFVFDNSNTEGDSYEVTLNDNKTVQGISVQGGRF